MAHLVDKVHLSPRQAHAGPCEHSPHARNDRDGLAACVFGAVVYDVGRLFSAW